MVNAYVFAVFFPPAYLARRRRTRDARPYVIVRTRNARPYVFLSIKNPPEFVRLDHPQPGFAVGVAWHVPVCPRRQRYRTDFWPVGQCAPLELVCEKAMVKEFERCAYFGFVVHTGKGADRKF